MKTQSKPMVTCGTCHLAEPIKGVVGGLKCLLQHDLKIRDAADDCDAKHKGAEARRPSDLVNPTKRGFLDDNVCWGPSLNSLLWLRNRPMADSMPPPGQDRGNFLQAPLQEWVLSRLRSAVSYLEDVRTFVGALPSSDGVAITYRDLNRAIVGILNLTGADSSGTPSTREEQLWNTLKRAYLHTPLPTTRCACCGKRVGLSPGADNGYPAFCSQECYNRYMGHIKVAVTNRS